ncbi:MAG: DUF983 domain-containing protein [Sphingomonadales bacterium]|nr:DUF983 domain-containing protein [Sphingomonadales bacterium]MBD3775432.1 DUF983 domain-containing protein [Paracoccaceae bacterium]
MADRVQSSRKATETKVVEKPSHAIELPPTGWAALLRGLLGRCPRCGEARLFARFLKPVAKCARCDQDWTHQQADDFPAYVSIFVTGHLMAPIIIGLTNVEGLSTLALVSIILPLTLILTVGLIQPAKGAIIALQWWFGMHGFTQERPDPTSGEGDP